MTIDALIHEFDHALRTLTGQYPPPSRPSPAAAMADDLVEPDTRLRVGRMMRVNLAGEVMAQALYHGQACMSRDADLRTHLQQSAQEEADHLHWCQQRLDELRLSPSLLNPLWYASGWLMGAGAASIGKSTNLGLVSAVEAQVESHLQQHLDQLPSDDHKTRAILEQMRDDESRHGQTAQALGASTLAPPLQWAMQSLSKLMTRGSLWI